MDDLGLDTESMAAGDPSAGMALEQGASTAPPPRINSPEEAAKLKPGTSFIGPDDKERVVPYKVSHPHEIADIPDGADFVGPDGKLRQKPKYEGIDFTAQALYDMGVNDKERKNALERSYKGKVRDDPSGGWFVEDDDGVMRKPSRGLSKYTGAIGGGAFPVAGSILGALGGGAAGTAVPGVGNVAGAAAGGAGGAILGQGFNDLIMGLAGTYDRTRGEEAAELGIAAAGGAAGAGVGRGIATVVPSLRTGLSAATAAAPGAARSFLGAGKEDLAMASSLAEKGVAVPPSAWAKEAPHLQNVVEVFDPAFHTNQPLLESATAHYEKSAGDILKTMGIKDPGSLTKPIADVPTKEAGEAVMRRTLGELAASDEKMQAALDAKKAALTSSDPVPAQFKRGSPDDTGFWFLEGDKPIYANASRSSVDKLYGPRGAEFDKFQSVTGANKRGEPITVWYKPGEQQRAMREVENFKQKANASSPAEEAKLHYESGVNLGYPEQAARSYVEKRFGMSQRETVLKAAEEARAAAQKVIDAGYKDIESDIKVGMKVANAGHNAGDLWGQVGQKLVAVRRAVGERANMMYDAADQAAGGHLPNIEGLPHQAEQFLEQLPPDFQNRYPAIVKNLRNLAGTKDPATGEFIKEPVNPTFGQLHNMRSQMRANINYSDLTPDIREGVYKFFAGKVDQILHATGDSVPEELKEASKLLKDADKFYAENIKLFNAQQVKAVMRGLESGEPADPQNLYNVVVKSGETGLTNAIKKQVGPNLWAGVEAADMQSIMDASKTLNPGEVDGKKFVQEILSRDRNNVLDVVYGTERAEKLREQARRVAMFDGSMPIPVRPNNTALQVLARAQQAGELAKAEAKRDPLAAFEKSMETVKKDHARELAKARLERRKDPLGFLYNPTTGASEAVDKILGSEDLILAAAAKFGETSPEFEMLRQVWAQRLLTGSSMRVDKALAGVSPEIQQLMFPGVTLNQARTLAREMPFLLDNINKGGAGSSMSAFSKVEHPASRAALAAGGFYLGGPVGAAAGLAVPPVARMALGSYYKLVRKMMTSPALLRWLEKGLNGSPADREAVRQSISKVLQKGGAVGAGAGEAAVQESGPPQ